ncbi:hypothetical protein A9Q75_00375, partial [Colwellia psychrerythraea]
MTTVTATETTGDAIKDSNVSKTPILAKEYLLPFILVAALFPLWGFANDITNPLVKAFKDI